MKNPSLYLERLIRELAKLPGIGPKSASRLAFHVLSMQQDDVDRLTNALVDVKTHITRCSVCGGISEGDVCPICRDDMREKDVLCVVKEAKDVLTIEATGEFHGKYHVLHGLISPLDGIGPDDLNIKPLLQRCRDGSVREIILALNPTVEGDATALYLAGLLGPSGILVTRIAYGLPVGSDLEFSDSATIARSIECRIKL
ncbi:MAG TPA: recombination mediator RecR [Spirochaetota bacterium]|nr:recombination mediator RecR [Spirochaetota bacterium]HPI88563.1 recombination mediator RecR [Spirochaetota bacterium]HPR48204.1 recombination mediator RecR [Spirochaetota bacterium]